MVDGDGHNLEWSDFECLASSESLGNLQSGHDVLVQVIHRGKMFG